MWFRYIQKHASQRFYANPVRIHVRPPKYFQTQHFQTNVRVALGLRLALEINVL